jgi:hypothetical protein
MKIPVSNDNQGVGHIYELETRLSDACNIKGPGILARACDSPMCPLVLTLVSNYGLRPGKDLGSPLKKMVQVVQQAFGPSKNVMWWLDYTMNHDPENHLVSDSPSSAMLKTDDRVARFRHSIICLFLF